MRWMFVLFLVCCAGNTVAQNGTPGLTESFAFEVKSIDDFIDRFNFRQDTEFMEYLSAYYSDEPIDRKRMILSLFNRRNKSFANNPEIRRFVADVTDSLRPSRIHFADYEWYATLDCSVEIGTVTESLELVLKVEKGPKNSTKWSIVSSRASFLTSTPARTAILEELDKAYVMNRSDSAGKRFLHPVSHALDFMNVDVAFEDKERFRDYFYKGTRTPELLKLAELVERSRLRFVQVNNIAYHFLQIPGWIMIVDYFNRNDRNNGWLINSLIRANPSLKLKYAETQLNLPVD